MMSFRGFEAKEARPDDKAMRCIRRGREEVCRIVGRERVAVEEEDMLKRGEKNRKNLKLVVCGLPYV